jgi:hypothetical protein
VFVFSSACTIALWFIVRFVYDRLWPAHRHDPALEQRRFWAITLTAASLAATAFWFTFDALFSRFAAWYAAALVGVTYVVLVVVLRGLHRAFSDDES